jgi:biotin synthesis protein BioG
MKYKWLNNQKQKELIIFFNGWGMDESVVSHLQPDNFDVLMFYDYNSLNTDFDFNMLNKYCSKNLVAWSMGVMIGTLFNIDYEIKTAINGTLNPIDDKYGIPKKIYNL